MKKILSYFIAVYILTLTVIPCMDHHDHQEPGTMTTITMSQSGNDQDHEDCCSPFCTCSCCHLPFDKAGTLIFGQDISFPEIVSFIYNPLIKSGHICAIWQPPKA